MRSTLDPARLSALNATRLSGVLRERGTTPVGAPIVFGTGAAVVADDASVWVVCDDVDRRLGAALAVAVRRSAERLVLVASDDSGRIAARRCLGVTIPVTVYRLDGREVVPVDAAALPAPRAPRADHLGLADVIEAGGAAVTVEHGVVAGEVRGLEVCRVVDDPVSGAVRLEVGIGAHDRETFQMLHGDRPTVDALADVVASVARHRAPGAAPHPLNQLAAARLLRSRAIDDPSLVGRRDLVAAEPPEPRANLKDEVPCVAISHEAGGLHAVVFVHGVDLDAVPFAIDAVARHAASSCTIAVAARDALPIQHALAELAAVPTRVLPLTLTDGTSDDDPSDERE